MFLRLLQFVLFQVMSVCLVSSTYAHSFSANRQFSLNQFSTEDGLSQGNVYQILKGSDGFIWVVTEDGLNKFDGYEFKVFKNIPGDSTSISDNVIWCVKEDRDSNIWVGTNQGGLCRYNKNQDNFTSFQFAIEDVNSISQNTVVIIEEASDGKLWVGTHYGLNILDKNSLVFKRIHTISEEKSLLDNRIFSIVEDDKKQVWVGTSLGISIYGLSGEFIRNISSYNTADFPDGRVTNMIKSPDGGIWASIDGAGLIRYDPAKDDFVVYRSEKGNYALGNNYVRSLLYDHNDQLWIGMDGYGFQIYDESVDGFIRVLQHSNLKPDQLEKVYEIYEDDQQNFWFGSYGYGVFLLNSNSVNFSHFNRDYVNENSLSNNSVLAISEAKDGKIWLGTDGGGLNVFDPQNLNFEIYKHESENPNSINGDVVKSVLHDSHGNAWLGLYNGGLELLKNGVKEFRHFTKENSGLTHNNVWALTEDRSGNIWIGTLGDGLNRYDPKIDKIEKYELAFDRDSTLSGINISTLVEDGDGNIWVGSGGQGINVFNMETGYSAQFKSSSTDSSQLSHNEIRFLFLSSKKEVWVGTTHGLNHYQKTTNSFLKYYESDGLPSNVIKGIVEDEQGMFWISTNNGICKFDPKSNRVFSFNKSDGVQGKEFNYNASIRSSDGLIYMGGINGFNQFDPRKIKVNEYQPSILLTKFLLFNRPVPIHKDGILKHEINQIERLEFEYDQYIFSIEYATDEYQFPKQNQYQYKLEGFDPDWNMVGVLRSATYTNLPAGKYQFLIRATNNAGVWSDKIRSLDIVVYPPWWQTKTSYAIFAAFSILVVIAIVRLRTSYLLAQKLRLRRLVSKRTKELEEKNERISMQAEELNAFNDSLNALNENLEKTVIQRTNELVVKNKKLSDYAFLNAHNLRAPVANIKGLMQLLDLDLTPEERDDYIQKLKQQVEDVDTVLYDINQRLREDTLTDQEKENVLNQSTNSSLSSSSSSS